MIRKSELLSYIDSVSDDVNWLTERVKDLATEVNCLKAKNICDSKQKRGRGRPKKYYEDELEKAIKDVTAVKSCNTKKQPRDKTGKFAKK